MTQHPSVASFLSFPSSPTQQRIRNACRFTSEPASPFNLPNFRHGASSVCMSLSTPASLSTLHLSSSSSSLLYANEAELQELPLAIPFVIVIGAVILAITAQSWINFLLRGDQGLGAFLSDGTGYNKSGFKPRSKLVNAGASNDAALEGSDPLPWLNLPRLDYVDVVGQPKRPKKVHLKAAGSDLNENNAQEVVLQMEHLRGQIRLLVEQGRLQQAKNIELELETIMKEHGYEFKTNT